MDKLMNDAKIGNTKEVIKALKDVNTYQIGVALNYATGYGHIDTVKAILSHERASKLTDREFRRCIDTAESMGYTEIAKLFIEKENEYLKTHPKNIIFGSKNNDGLDKLQAWANTNKNSSNKGLEISKV